MDLEDQPMNANRFLVAASVLFAFLFSSPLNLGALAQNQAPEPQGRLVRVPLDHFDVASGHFELYYELGAPFDARKPTVFFLTDGQQFHVRKGRMSKIQDELFGEELNVVGIVGRGSTEAVQKRALRNDGSVDWQVANRLLSSQQWVEDVESVRRDLLGPNGKILLYGRSGGGFLVHEYLSRHGHHVLRAFVQSAPNPFLEAEFGLNTDHFWEEISACDSSLPENLTRVLTRLADERKSLIQVLQRQNFFVPRSGLLAARARLITELDQGKNDLYEQLKTEYQVNALTQLMDSPAGMAIRVRLYEFYQPVHRATERFDRALYPDKENTFHLAGPLLQLYDQGQIPAATMNLNALRNIATGMFILAGRYDHTSDYRIQMALASYYPNHLVFIADDDHVLHALEASGLYPALVRSTLLHGFDSHEAQNLLRQLDSLRWRER